jgi:hypothetical protein
LLKGRNELTAVGTRELIKVSKMFNINSLYLIEQINKLPIFLSISEKYTESKPRNKDEREDLTQLIKLLEEEERIFTRMHHTFKVKIDVFSKIMPIEDTYDLINNSSNVRDIYINSHISGLKFYKRLFICMLKNIPVDKGGRKKYSASKCTIWYLAEIYKEGAKSVPSCKNMREGEFEGDFFEFLQEIAPIILADFKIKLGSRDTMGQYASGICREFYKKSTSSTPE